MKLIKYITRAYSLRDHALIIESLYKKNTSISELYYRNVVDISVKGLISIYVDPQDVSNNTKRLQWVINKPGYVSRRIKEGQAAIDNLNNLPLSALKGTRALSDQEIIKIVKLIRSKLFVFSGFFELTHYIGRLDVRLTPTRIKKLGKFHDQRKDAFMNVFYFLNALFERKLKNSNILNKKLNFLTMAEIIDYFNHKISVAYVNREQSKRMKRYICIYKNQKEKIITGSFDEKLKSLKRDMEISPISQSVKGNPINRGIVKGKVKVITQNTPYKEIPKNAIIVTQMSTPEMTPFIKKAKALITDEGGLLCHAAVFAREFKIITILGTKVATRVFKDGDEVEVNAAKGTVKILKE